MSTPFSLRKMLAEYCENDTMILMEAVLAMRKIVLKITKGYDVMAKATSVAGIAMAVYRCRFLKPNTIAIVPEKGYERHDRASDIAIKLLEWRAKQLGVEILHAGNGREYQFAIDGKMYKLDGYTKEHNHAIEFLNCHYHSHPECTNPDDVAPNGKLNSINYSETMERIDKIRSYGFTVEIGRLICFLFIE
jgi:hypothetical protein